MSEYDKNFNILDEKSKTELFSLSLLCMSWIIDWFMIFLKFRGFTRNCSLSRLIHEVQTWITWELDELLIAEMQLSFWNGFFKGKKLNIQLDFFTSSSSKFQVIQV